MQQKIVFVGKVHGVKVYWDGKRWTSQLSEAKRYERNAPIIVMSDGTSMLAGIDAFYAECAAFPGPKDWSPRREHGLVRRPS